MIDGSALHPQVVNIVNHWGYFIYLSWMPSYFHQVAPALACALPPLSCADSDGSVTSWQVAQLCKEACMSVFPGASRVCRSSSAAATHS